MAFRTMPYWRRNLLLISVLLAIWLVATFVPVYFARQLSKVFIFGWPFSFWMAAFGAPAIFLIVIGVYAWQMDRADARLRQQERDL